MTQGSKYKAQERVHLIFTSSSSIEGVERENSMNQPNIIAWLKPSCGWSKGVRAVLRKYNLPFDDRDVINNPAHYEEMVARSGQPLQPTLEIDGHILADVSGEEVEAWLIEKGYVKRSSASTDVPINQSCQDHPAPTVKFGVGRA
jgi:monothiol glutaredoxin